MSQEYILAVGETDRQRLEILNRMYNPITQYFLTQNGLKQGMTVLEVGCGTGDMACWLANQIGKKGKVVAIDNSSAQIKLSSEKAKNKGINNIEFLCLDVRDLATLNQQFDFAYGRWVISFLPDQHSIFQNILSVLKSGGILSYETASNVGEGYFSYPATPVVAEWFKISEQFFKKNKFCLDLGNQLFHLYGKLGLSNIQIMANQPIMKTPEEKSVMRIGSTNAKDQLLKLMDEKNYQRYIQGLEAFEQSDAIAGFYRNILAAGVKV
ncbi:MAG: hypothetical protein A3E87_03945 [Gammaproteobacteria bacterium RIFCSPHIGHO2_12_FULL_35_23]|nr:MAG: hypothetical protein A3E87_03945 [Gammaproteobacteria bacterium RIFCSPHIGHO2_12_FULL_35_23]